MLCQKRYVSPFYLVCIVLLLGVGSAGAGLFDGLILRKANTLYGQGKYEEALWEYERLRDANYENAIAYYGIASVYYVLGNYFLAKQNYTSATEIEPGFALAFYWLGNTWWKTGEEKKAMDCWKEALKKDAENPVFQEKVRLIKK